MSPSSSDRLGPHRGRTIAIMLLAAAALLPIGCDSDPAIRKGASQALLQHIVLISLQDPSEAAELRADCSRLLPPIESVRTWWIGTPVDTGRAAVDGDYEVGLCVGFDSLEGLAIYQGDPRHLELVELWKPRATGFRIFDVGQAGLSR